MFIECFYDWDDLWWYSIGVHYHPEGVLMDTVEGLPEVHEIDVEGCIPFQTLLYDVMQSKDLSIHPLPFLKPACSCLILVSIAVSIRLRRTLQNTLLGIDRRVIPCQLSQLLMLPFLGILTLRPLNQSSGMVSLFQMSWNRSVSTRVDVRMSALSISA